MSIVKKLTESKVLHVHALTPKAFNKAKEKGYVINIITKQKWLEMRLAKLSKEILKLSKHLKNLQTIGSINSRKQYLILLEDLFIPLTIEMRDLHAELEIVKKTNRRIYMDQA